MKNLVNKDGYIPADDRFERTLTYLLSGCRVNILLGAGFSAGYSEPLGNCELIFEALDSYEAQSPDAFQKIKALRAYMYWNFFKKSIFPLTDIYPSKDNTNKDTHFEKFTDFANRLSDIISYRSVPELNQQFNIFTTNYDPILELAFDKSMFLYNDGFLGRFDPRFSTKNFGISFYSKGMASGRLAERASVNLIKIHGSLTWQYADGDEDITYCDVRGKISSFYDKYANQLNEEKIKVILDKFNEQSKDEIREQLEVIINSENDESAFWDTDKEVSPEDFIAEYMKTFLIVNPTKDKFKSTLLNKNYYEMLRLFSNELEKENSLLIAFGFSFRDEHIQDLINRAVINPSLLILIFVYDKDEIHQMKERFKNIRSNNVFFIATKEADSKLGLERLNEILTNVSTTTRFAR